MTTLKNALQSLVILLVFTCLHQQVSAQLFGTNAVGRNNYVEVGLNACGVYGSNGQPPAAWGYHPNVFAGLGFVCDYQRDGWTVATAGGLNYCGDYFVPGSPVEGWALTFNGVDRINTNSTCVAGAIPGAITKWVNTATIDTMEWTGAVGGMSVLQRTLIPNDSLYFITEVVLCNTTATTMTGVYYGRNVDPDNEQPWGFAFTTTNTIVSQPSPTTSDALVTALGPTGRCFLGLGARDNRARVNHGGFGTIPADDLYFGVGRTTAVGGVTTSDIAIGIGFSLGSLAPGECTCLSFVYVMSASMLGSALSATTGIIISADTTDITATGSTTLCMGDSVAINLGGAAGSYTWTWSPPTGLSSTTGTTVIAFPTTTTTYTVVGTGIGFTCTDDTLTITITVDDVVADAGPDIVGCPGETLSIGLPPPIAGETYAWSPTGPIIGSSTTTPVSVVFPSAGSYTFYMTTTHPATGCSDVDSMMVTITPNPPPGFTVADDSLCVGTATSMVFTGDTTGATSYVWTVTGTSVPASFSGPGPHSLSWTTGGMKYIDLYVIYGICTTQVATDSVMIWEYPIADISPVADQCFDGHSFSFANSTAWPTADYSWTFGPDATPGSSTATAPSGVTFATPGIKFVILSLNNHGCGDSDTLLFTVNPEPPPAFTISATETCLGDPVTVTFTGVTAGATSYLWTVSGVSSPATLSGAGPHVVSWSTSGMKDITLTMVYGPCTTGVAIDSIMVWEYPVASIAPVPDQCFDHGANSFDFSNLGAYDATATFAWSFGPDAVPPVSTSEFPTGINFTTPGPKQAVLVVQQHGCISNIDTVFFNVFPDPDPSFTYTGGVQCFDSNLYDFTVFPIHAGATYTWSFPGATPTSAVGTNPTGIHYLACGPQSASVTMTENGCSTTYTDTITILCDPIVDAGLPVAFCEGTGGATVTATGTGGTPVYYYTWWCEAALAPCGIDSVFDNDPLVNPTMSGWYYVQITDFNGCNSNIDSVYVTVYPKPIADAGPDLTICQAPAPCENLSGSASNSSGPYSYQWFPSLGLSNDTIPNPCARPDTTTIYTLVVTDLTTGCTSDFTTTDTTSTVTVTVLPLPVADAGDDRHICEGDTAMLMGIGYDAGPSYAYEWSPYTPPVSLSANNIPNPLAFPNLTTDYILTVWSNGCPSYGDTVTVFVHTNPTVDAGPDRDICQGESAILDGQAFGDPLSFTYSYTWWDSLTLNDPHLEDPTATPDTTTTYFVQAISEWGCISPVDQVLVRVKPSPIADAGTPLSICAGDSIQLPATISFLGTLPPPPGTVVTTWTPATNIDDATLVQPTVWPTTTMYYVMTVDHNTCQDVDSVLVTVFQTPQISLQADTNVICEGGGTQLFSSGGLGGASVVWTPAAGLSDPFSPNPFASPDSSTTYTVTYSEGGCSDQDQIRLDVIPTPEAQYMSSQPRGCAPLTVNFLETSTDALNYIWDFGDGSPVSNELNPVHIYQLPGTYTVTLIAVNLGGCADTINTIVVEVSDPGIAEFTADPGFPAQLSLPNTTVQFLDRSLEATSWLWTFGDGSTSQETNPVHTYTLPGEYSVTLTVTSADGCLSQVIHGPFVILAPDLFIPNVFSPNDDGINDEWLVIYTGDQPASYNVYDRWGTKLFETVNKMEGWNGTDLEGSPVIDGVYFYRVRVGDKEYAGNVTLIR